MNELIYNQNPAYYYVHRNNDYTAQKKFDFKTSALVFLEIFKNYGPAVFVQYLQNLSKLNSAALAISQTVYDVSNWHVSDPQGINPRLGASVLPIFDFLRSFFIDRDNARKAQEYAQMIADGELESKLEESEEWVVDRAAAFSRFTFDLQRKVEKIVEYARQKIMKVARIENRRIDGEDAAEMILDEGHIEPGRNAIPELLSKVKGVGDIIRANDITLSHPFMIEIGIISDNLSQLIDRHYEFAIDNKYIKPLSPVLFNNHVNRMCDLHQCLRPYSDNENMHYQNVGSKLETIKYLISKYFEGGYDSNEINSLKLLRAINRRLAELSNVVLVV